MRRSNNFTCLLLSVMFLPALLEQRHRNSRHDHIPGRTTLVSAREWFELGFFSPNGRSDSRRYIVIWYYRSDLQIVVWVANWDKPLVGPNASFGLVDGNLKLWNEGREIPLTDIEGSSSSTRLVKLLDSGNLVLNDSREGIRWQSFEHPTDTFLPGMLMVDNFVLISWASQDDPKQGNFTFHMDQEGSNNNSEVIRELSPYWTSGVYGKFIQADPMLDVISFLLSNFTTATATSLPAGTSPAYKNLTKPSDNNYNNSRLVMNHDGRIQYFRQGNGSKPAWFEPASQCSVSRACGKFGSCNDENGYKTMCRC